MTAHTGPVPLGEAIREVRGSMTQEALAAAVSTDQGTVSRWEKGGLRPTLDDLVAIEMACKVPRGTILRRSGYVDEVTTAEDLLEADSSIGRADLDLIKSAITTARNRRR